MKTMKIIGCAVFACGLTLNLSAAEYTQGEIYQAMCQKCHGEYGEGNPAKKGPSLIDRTQAELAVEIYELDGGGYQSSGTAHEEMDSNLTAIEKKGMIVDADKMAAYIYNNFVKKQ
jgi:cytochrome c553